MYKGLCQSWSKANLRSNKSHHNIKPFFTNGNWNEVSGIRFRPAWKNRVGPKSLNRDDKFKTITRKNISMCMV